MEMEWSLPDEGRIRLVQLPDDPKGVAIVCPGGGYEWLSPREADPVAAAFGRYGWAGAVLSYQVGRNLGTTPLRQLGAAVSLMRKNYPGIPVIVCGFSAGGHLAASLGVHWRTLGLERPDALALAYPVITAGNYAHQTSICNLEGGDRDRSFFSLETHVDSHMPPAFIWHTAEDPEVPVQNSLLLAAAMAKAGVPFELVVYPRGEHGLSLATPEVEDLEKKRYADRHVAGWFGQCMDWLNTFIEGVRENEALE